MRQPAARCAATLGVACALTAFATPAAAAPRPLTFSAEDTGPGSGYTSAVRTADFDGDGADEVVRNEFLDGTVSVLRRDPTGGGWTPLMKGTVNGSPRDVAVSDFDGDGRPDVAALLESSQVSILLQNAAGDGLTPGPTYPTGRFPIDIATGDVDGDGLQDVVTADLGADAVTILLQEPGGAGFRSRTVSVGSRPYGVAVADLDGDGRQDIATAESGGPTVSILTQTPSGDFDRTTVPVSRTSPSKIVAADVDHDGVRDLVVGDGAADGLSLLRRTPAGGYDETPVATPGSEPTYLAEGDLDGDGTSDVAIANLNGTPGLSVLRVDPADGTPVVEGLPETPTARTGWISVAVGDVDGDGRADVAASTGGQPTDSVVVLRNTTDLTAPTISLTRPDAAGTSTYAVGERVTADYACLDEAGGSGVDTCTGPVAPGGLLDTATPGSKTFAVTAKDAAGNTITRTATYRVVAPTAGGAAPSGPGGSAIPTPVPPSFATPGPPPVAATPSTTVGRVTVGAPGPVRRGRGFDVPVTVTGPGRLEAIATAPKPRTGVAATPRVLAPSRGRFTYARATTRRTTGAGTLRLRLVGTRAASRARFRTRTVTVRVAVRFTPDGGRPVLTSRLVRVPTRR